MENKLGAVVAARESSPSSPSVSMSSVGGGRESGGSDVEADLKKIKMKKKEFQLHRKAHYNEMEAVRKWKAEHMDEDNDDDE